MLAEASTSLPFFQHGLMLSQCQLHCLKTALVAMQGSTTVMTTSCVAEHTLCWQVSEAMADLTSSICHVWQTLAVLSCHTTAGTFLHTSGTNFSHFCDLPRGQNLGCRCDDHSEFLQNPYNIISK
jgi:hypothetical protein